jgi:hypothetical protein
MVCINLGDSFAPPVPWGSKTPVNVDLLSSLKYYNPQSGMESPQSGLSSSSIPGNAQSPFQIGDEISSSTTFNWSAYGDVGFQFSWTFWIFFIPITPFIGFGFNLSGGSGTTSITSSMQDIDGDGVPDNIFNSGGDMYVRLNQSRIDGLVNEIDTPQGGVINLTYTPAGNTVGNNMDDPHTHMVLTQVTKTNFNATTIQGSPASLVPSQAVTTTYGYGAGNYNRADRRFRGFASATTTKADGVYQTVTYNNTAYYLRNKPQTAITYDSQNNVIERQTNSYKVS